MGDPCNNETEPSFQLWKETGMGGQGSLVAGHCSCLLNEVEPSWNKDLRNRPAGLPAPATAEGMSHLAEDSLAVLD